MKKVKDPNKGKSRKVTKEAVKKPGKLKTALSLAGFAIGVVAAAYMVNFTQTFLRVMDDAMSEEDS